MALTAHFIDKDWNLFAKTIDFHPIPGKHRGLDIKKAFLDIVGLRKFGISGKMLGITMDNASNNNVFAEVLSEELESFGIENKYTIVSNLGSHVLLMLFTSLSLTPPNIYLNQLMT
jgi:hypothetical protein